MKHILSRSLGWNRRKHSCFIVTLLQVVAWHKRLGAGKCRHIEVKWLWLPAGHGREEVGDEACGHRYGGVDEQQNTETDEPDANELGCWCGVSCRAAKGENHVDVLS